MKQWSFDVRSGGLLDAVLAGKSSEQAWKDHWYECVYAAIRLRLANASVASLRSDGATVSNGLAVNPIS